MFSMHTAHLANVSKSVTKNATFPRTGGLPCLITHSCMSAASPTVVGGLIFCISATPQPGCLFPLFHDDTTLLNFLFHFGSFWREAEPCWPPGSYLGVG